MRVSRMVVALFALVFVSFASAQTVERPEVRKGMSWKYSFHDTKYPRVPDSNYTYTIRVKAVDGTRVVAERLAEDGTNTPLLFDSDLNFVGKESGPDAYAYLAFQFPLAAGKTWQFKYHASNGQGVVWENTVAATVIGPEKVSVPAGTFDAIKVRLVRDYSGKSSLRSWSGTVTDMWWYAPGVNNFVKRVVTDSNMGGDRAPQIMALEAYNPATATATAEAPSEKKVSN